MTRGAVQAGQTEGMSADTSRQARVVDVPTAPHPVLPAWAGDVIAAAVIVALAFAPFPGEEFRPTGWATTLLMIAPAVLLPLRGRWPKAILGACLGFYGVAAFVGLLSPGIGLAVGIAMFGVANRSTRRVTIITGAITVLVVFLLSILAGVGSVFDPRVFQFVFAIAFTAAAGDGARSRRAYIAAITERAEKAEQTREMEAQRRVTEERLRLARDLHDAVAHQIAVISLNAGVASSTLSENPERAASALATIRLAARTVLSEIGNLMTMLRSDGGGPAVALPQFGLDQLGELLEEFGHTGLDVHSRIDGDYEYVTGAVGLVAYRVIQEALTNAHKHGTGHRAHLLLETNTDTIRIVITNPVGGHALETAAGVGVGLIGLRERVASVGGSVQAGPAHGGWKLSAVLPLRRIAS